ncbi:AbrB/MazE/SpoVT family DNA-binding domain-containing protein [Halobaculum sp. MBLA0147]|uniref:AbrB/MazE/SpoVT family DNA-binding domain-containing protein n=1 Tax=Halobaculum sp. MBLA0147 TaxID=3079934 RepID=UPI0035264B06
MVTVDAKGRVVLPQEVRERLGLAPGTEVTVREQDGVAVVEPEDDPEEILDRMESLLEGAPDRDPTPYEDLDPRARDQVDTIREAAADDDETNGDGAVDRDEAGSDEAGGDEADGSEVDGDDTDGDATETGGPGTDE